MTGIEVALATGLLMFGVLGSGVIVYLAQRAYYDYQYQKQLNGQEVKFLEEE